MTLDAESKLTDQIDFNTKDPSLDDWGYFETAPKSVWWVKVKLRNGREGWTRETQNFAGKDKCG